MMNNNHENTLLGSTRELIDALLGLAQTRAEIVAVELQEEKWRLIKLLVAAAAMASLVVMSITLLTVAAAAFALGYSGGMLLGTIAILYGALSALLYVWLTRTVIKSARPFSGTVAEFEKDRTCLEHLNSRN